MIEKIRFGGEWSLKKWVAAVLFGAIIIVFALWGVTSPDMGGTGGGVAAVVNDRTISVAEFNNRVQQVEQNARARMEGIPEAQRRALTASIRQRVLDQMILDELMFQAANHRGVTASDAEVKEQILAIPFLQENGRFLGDRYRMWLTNMNMSAQDFERQIRKQLVTQKMQEMFVNAATPTREELKRNRMLANQKVNLRFNEIGREDLNKLGFISEADVIEYTKANRPAVEAYYNDNKLEFTTPEKYRARDLLVRFDQKRPEAEALKLITDLHKQANAANFAKLASQHSEDPGSKAKGGDLGERERGSMMPEFEQVALKLQPGQISEPIKLDGGYHLILLESKTPGSTRELVKVEADIARKLISRGKENEIVGKIREAVESGDRKAIDALVVRAGTKWRETGDFDLSSPSVPKLGEAKDLMPAVLAQGKSTGLVKRLIPYQGKYVIVEVLGWKETPDNTPDVEGLDRMVAYRKAESALEAWSKEVQSSASITKNDRLLQ
ncbi:MAG: SurA N-terminal domain-containing protein [Bdellovibrionales bacterium]|nr:SurA N-terminal domain-containing protein [Bdellovibrionales bacterium]